MDRNLARCHLELGVYGHQTNTGSRHEFFDGCDVCTSSVLECAQMRNDILKFGTDAHLQYHVPELTGPNPPEAKRRVERIARIHYTQNCPSR